MCPQIKEITQEETKHHWWISWYQPTDDHRPLTFPPNGQILGYWCTGEATGHGHTMVAYVEAPTKEEAELAVQKDWPEALEWRFCNQCEPGYRPNRSGRFPKADWHRY